MSSINFEGIPAPTMKLTDTEYRVLSDLYHEVNGAFKRLPLEYQSAFYAHLYKKD